MTPTLTEFRIFRAGVNRSEKGTFVFDSAAADSVMREYKSHGKPLLLDYNHGSTLFDPTPEQGVAAGEFTPEIRDGELWATRIRWTPRAAQMLAAREYRLFSPYFEHEPATGRILRLVNVALTNLPALDDIAPLMAASAAHRGGGRPGASVVSPERVAIARQTGTSIAEIEAWEAAPRRR